MDSRRTRWFIIALLFAATAINYIDRQTLSVLNDTLRSELHFSDVGYANVVTAFLVSYTIMYSVGGRLIDYLGARMGLALTLAWWSVATMLTGLSHGVFSLGVFRFLLGVGEPCVYPAGLKSCTDWFPPKERALPFGIFSSGSALGAVIAPPFVAWLTLRFSWRYAFLLP
jgi:ACS family hexuronate transporter-like MFS transporter